MKSIQQKIAAADNLALWVQRFLEAQEKGFETRQWHEANVARGQLKNALKHYRSK